MSVIYDSSNHFPIDVRPRRQRCPRHLDSSQFPLSLSINYIKRSGYKSIGVALLESNILPIRPTFNLLFSRETKRNDVYPREREEEGKKEEGRKERRGEEERREKEEQGGEEHAQFYLYRRRNLSHRSRSVGRLGLARWLIISSGNIARYSRSSSDNAISIPRPSGAYGGAAISYKNHDRVCVHLVHHTRVKSMRAHVRERPRTPLATLKPFWVVRVSGVRVTDAYMHQDDRSSASSFFSTALLTGLPPCVHPPTSQNPLPGRERERRVLETHRSRTHRARTDDRMIAPNCFRDGRTADTAAGQGFDAWMDG